MSYLFSTPGSQAGQAASGASAAAQPWVNQGVNYWTGAENNYRNAIAGLGNNPFFAAADQMSPGAYAVNPRDTVAFSEQLPQPEQPKQPKQPKMNPFSKAKAA